MRVATPAIVLLVAALGCADRNAPSVPDPDLAGVEPQVAERMREARQAVVDDPESAAAWGELGAVYDAHVLSEAAEPCYRRAGQLAPDEFRWIYLLAIVREINGGTADEIAVLFGRALELRPDYTPAHIRLGDALWRRGEYAAAQAELELALAREPGAAIARRRLGQVLLALDEPRAAAEQLKRAIELEPGDLAAHRTLSRVLMRLGEADRAEEVLRRSRGLEPIHALDDPVHRQEVGRRGISSSRAFARGVAAAQAGVWADAVSDLRIVLDVRPHDASAHFWMGLARQGLQEIDVATWHMSRAVELQPTMAPAWLRLGRLHVASGRLDDAVADYRRALELVPDDVVARAALDRLLDAIDSDSQDR